MSYKYKKYTKLNPHEKKILLEWWGSETTKEPHMITESPENLEANLIEGVIVYKNNKIIAASGIFPARTKSHQEIYHNNFFVVELGSNYVDPNDREKGIGKQLLVMRLKICSKNKWFPVSVTTNKTMQHIFKTNGGIDMDNKPIFEKIRKDLCICKIISPECKACPLQEKGGWVFMNLG
jgi:N-acetylglutamate synthase-like GNAT family acetyltransferase